ncbi:MAG: peptide chain release factor N(5)-glutamine methyltransferase [Rhizobiaceae bacterium]|nr:peptide chain release factor N(5)-glutamine methyltransferase [Rhizobiaceae bacterium]
MPDRPSFAELLLSAVNAFDYAGVDTPQLDARLLLSHAAGITHAEFISRTHDLVDEAIQDRFSDYVSRRLASEPVHRITGSREFYGREFELGPGSLVPRPDTETLVDIVVGTISDKSQPLKILDLGTGSGAIAVTLACELPAVNVVAVDISENALLDCAANASRLGVENRVHTLQSNMFENVEGVFDLIVSNPPYIPTGDLDRLAPEVRQHDPLGALDGGVDGLDFYRLIFSEAREHINAKGHLVMEFGIDQSDQMKSLARKHGWRDIIIRNDLAGIPRVLMANS